MGHVITWFEIPAQDVARAAKFYEAVLQRKINLADMGGVTHAFFEHTADEVSGAIVKEEGLTPGKQGVLVYFHCEDIDQYVERIEQAGGTVELGKTLIAPEIGYLAKFIDTEGNRVALYSKT